MIFSISNLNPLRFIDTSTINDSFDGDFAVRQILSYQNPECYFQKWQRSDVLKLQLLSDFVPDDLSFKDVCTNAIISTASWAEVETIITGQTFRCYQLEFDISVLPEGKYYAEFAYTDQDLYYHLLISEPFSIADVQDNTMLLSYKNSENNFDVIFDTGIEFEFRVESAIKNYSPGNDRFVYTDQKQNPTLLSAVPFRKFKFYLGYQKGFPGWVIDKVNWIQSVDQVAYNGVYYQIADGAEYETETNDANEYTGGSIDIQPTDNNFNKYRTEPSDTANTFIPMQKVTRYFNVADNFNIPGVFKPLSILEYICVKKRSAGIITLNVGTTPGGNEIGVFSVNDPDFTQTIEWLFNATSTVYLTGLSGADCDIYIVYKQLDEPPVPIVGSPVVPPSELKPGSVILYEEVDPGDLDRDFDLSTGVGKPNTGWENWVLCDGRNGTKNMKGRVPVMQDPADVQFDTIGEMGGSKTHKLTVQELPAHNHGYEGANNPGGNGTGNRKNVPTGKATDMTGGDQPHNNLQPYIVSLFVKKIA